MIDYNVLWFEDDKIWQGNQQKLLIGMAAKKHVKLVCKSIVDVDDFMNNYKKEDPYFNKFDLIVIDYNLSSEKFSGKDLIVFFKELMWDKVFYSNTPEIVDEFLSKPCAEMESIYISSKDTYKVKILELITKHINRSLNIKQLRGVLMNETAEYDFIMKTVIENLFGELDPSEKEKFLQSVKEKINISKNIILENFKNIEKCVDNEKIKKILNSIVYVLPMEEKYKLLNEILEIKQKSINFSFKEYDENIIKIRNKFGHKRIEYGKCPDIIKIIDSYDDLLNNYCEFCDGTCKVREYNRFSLTDCQNIYENIFKYNEYFNRLLLTIVK